MPKQKHDPDRYGTRAAQTEDLAKALRISFVRMYTEHAPLTEVRERIATMYPNLAKDWFTESRETKYIQVGNARVELVVSWEHEYTSRAP